MAIENIDDIGDGISTVLTAPIAAGNGGDPVTISIDDASKLPDTGEKKHFTIVKAGASGELVNSYSGWTSKEENNLIACVCNEETRNAAAIGDKLNYGLNSGWIKNTKEQLAELEVDVNEVQDKVSRAYIFSGVVESQTHLNNFITAAEENKSAIIKPIDGIYALNDHFPVNSGMDISIEKGVEFDGIFGATSTYGIRSKTPTVVSSTMASWTSGASGNTIRLLEPSGDMTDVVNNPGDYRAYMSDTARWFNILAANNVGDATITIDGDYLNMTDYQTCHVVKTNTRKATMRGELVIHNPGSVDMQYCETVNFETTHSRFLYEGRPRRACPRSGNSPVCMAGT